jgi:hypothetical protein
VFSVDDPGQGGKGDQSQLWTTIGAGGAQQIHASDGSPFSGLSNFVTLGSKVLFWSSSSSGGEAL